MKKFQTIYADLPWMEQGGGKIKRAADEHYPLMKTREIMNLTVWNFTATNCHLYLWATNNFLPDALKVMDYWGFKYKTMITWVKNRFGLGQYFRGQTEHCLFGVKGNIPYKILDGKRAQGVTVIQAPRKEHSRKPEEMRQMIEKVSVGPFLEMFARRPYPGWEVWGNEVESNVVLD